MKDKIIAVFSRILNRDRNYFRDDMRLGELKLDNISISRILLAIDDQFGIFIEDAEFNEHMTFSSFVSLCENKVKNKGPKVSDIVLVIIQELVPGTKNRVSLATDLRNEFNVDSLLIAQIVIETEQYFGIDISEKEVNETNTIGDFVSLVSDKVNNR